jgi:hypothetical protein
MAVTIDVIFSGSFPCRPFMFLFPLPISLNGPAVMSSHGFPFSASPSSIMAFMCIFHLYEAFNNLTMIDFLTELMLKIHPFFDYLTPKLKKIGNPKVGN